MSRKVVSFFEQAARNAEAFKIIEQVYQQYPLAHLADQTIYPFEDYWGKHETTLIGYQILDIHNKGQKIFEEACKKANRSSSHYSDPTLPTVLFPHLCEEKTPGRKSEILFFSDRLKTNMDYLNTLNMNIIKSIHNDYLKHNLKITAINPDEFDKTKILIDAFDLNDFEILSVTAKTENQLKQVYATDNLFNISIRCAEAIDEDDETTGYFATMSQPLLSTNPISDTARSKKSSGLIA